MREHLLIVGAGQAAAQAILTLRQSGFDGRISLIGEESHLPYQRPPLSKKYLSGELPRARLALRPASFYDEKGVELLLGRRAEELEPTARRLRLDDGRSVPYDRLLLATGSRARRLDVPGSALGGVHYLRTLDDVDSIAADLVPGARLVLVGAGYIGLEAAAVAAQRGFDVTVLEAGDRVMSRVVCPAVSEFYHRRHVEAGVEIRYGTTVRGFVGTRDVEAVEASDGSRYGCDVVVVGVGIEPNTELAAGAGLSCSNGIDVDEYARTEDPLIAAAGDCTSHPHPLIGRRVRLESVQNAIEQAKAAAAGLAGSPRPYADVPWFWSDQYDLKLQIAGLSQEHDETAIRGVPAAAGFAVYYLRAGALIAVDAVNSPRDFMFGKQLIAARWRGSASVLADPAFDPAKEAERLRQLT